MIAQPEIYLLVQYQAKPGKAEATKRATLEYGGHATKEPNCIQVWFHEHPDDPHKFMLFELWTDAANFNGPQHQESAAMLRFAEQLEELLVAPMQIEQWRLVKHTVGPAGGA